MKQEVQSKKKRTKGLPRRRQAAGEPESPQGPGGTADNQPLVVEGRLRETLDGMLEGCQIIGYDWRYLYLNDAVAQHARATKEQLLGKTMMEAYPGIEKTEMFSALRRCMEQRVPSGMENEFTFPDGQTGWFELRIEPTPSGILILSVEITERKLAEERLRRTARALRTLSKCNQVVIRATEESSLLQGVCRVIVGAAGYRLAWAGLAQQDEDKTVLPVAEAGYGEQYVEQLHITWGDTPRGRGPTGTAIRSGQPVVCRNILTDPQYAPWREQAVRFGYGASIALPLIAEHTVLGALNVYASEPDAYDSEEVKLLQEMADDVAYAIVALRTRAKADRLNDELRQSEQKYRLHFEQASDVIYSLDRQFRVLTVSPSVQTLLGYDPEELVGVPFPELGIVAPESMAMAVSDAMRVLSGARVSASVYEFVGKDGTRKFGEVSAAPFFEGGEIAGLVSVARDITDRKRAEEELQRTLQNLDEALVGTINTLALVVEHRDPYTAGHQRRVASLAQAMAMEMGLSRDRVEGIRVAGSIHDLGKLFIPAEILSKPGHLSEDELQLIETHPGAAYDILKEVVFPWPVAEIVLQHHERVDGSGYPQHLRGEDTMLEARIIAVADVVEAMASHRPYRAALGIEKALEEIAAQRAVVYDSEAVGACLKLFREKGFELD